MSPASENPILILDADETHLPALTAIYNQAIASRTATADMEPATVQQRRDWLADHSADQYPVYVAEIAGKVVGYASLSRYRRGRQALRHTAEISYFVDENFQRRGVGSQLIAHTLQQCPRLNIRNVFGILLDINHGSVRILEKFGFEQWGHLPDVADFDGAVCGHLYYGRSVDQPGNP